MPLTTIDETVGNGICLYDVDDDGAIDIFIPNGSRGRPYPPGEAPRSALYRNKGGGAFEDITERAGVASIGYWAQGCVFGDYDDDGRIDLFLTGFGRYILYRGLGGGRFQDVTASSGLKGRGWSTGAAFGDYDGDGRIDLYVSHYVDYDASSPPLPRPGTLKNCFYKGAPVICGPGGLKPSIGRLFHNEGNGTFRDVTRGSGLVTRPTGYGLGAVWSDLDLDGDLDLFVANDTTPNWLYRNDNDGRQDLFIANGHVFPNIDDRHLGTTWKQHNQLFHNEGGGRFLEVTSQAGPAFEELHSARGAAFGDIDDDGDVDIIVNNIDEPPALLRNDGGNALHWIGFRLLGARRNRGAVGARVTVSAGLLRQTREIHAGSSHNSSNDPRLLFGLGSSTRVDRVEIRWPLGRTQVLTDLPIDRYHIVHEPDKDAQ